jgi:hypothetical protein
VFPAEGTPGGDGLSRQSFDGSRDILATTLASDHEAARWRRSLKHEMSIGEQKENIIHRCGRVGIKA